MKSIQSIVSTQSSIDELKSAQALDTVSGDDLLAYGIRAEMDTEKGDLEAVFSSPEGVLLAASFQARTPGRWLSLTLPLGGESLADFGVIGLACDSSANRTVACRISIRTGSPDGFTDSFFAKHMVSYSEPSFHVDALQIAQHPELQGEAAWRNLMFHFQPQSFDISLRDLRIFVA